MEKLEKAPTITRVVHEITLQVVEIDNDPKNLSITLRNPNSVPSDIVLLMMAEAAKVVQQWEKHNKKKEGQA